MITEFFQHDFLLRALIAGIAIAVTTGMMGNFVVAGRNAIVSDMLAHAALAGVGVGIFWNISPTLSGASVTVFAALMLWFLRRQDRLAPEASAMLIMTGSLSLALVFAHLAKDNPLSLETFLFGSILTITPSELMMTLAVNAGVICLLLLFWNRLCAVIFDREFCVSRFQSNDLMEVMFMVLVGSLVAFSIKIIGGLLIGALLVIPVLCAQFVSRSFVQSVFWSITCNLLAVVVGLVLSLHFDTPSSSSIVLVLIGLFVLIAISTKTVQKVSAQR